MIFCLSSPNQNIVELWDPYQLIIQGSRTLPHCVFFISVLISVAVFKAIFLALSVPVPSLGPSFSKKPYPFRFLLALRPDRCVFRNIIHLHLSEADF